MVGRAGPVVEPLGDCFNGKVDCPLIEKAWSHSPMAATNPSPMKISAVFAVDVPLEPVDFLPELPGELVSGDVELPALFVDF